MFRSSIGAMLSLLLSLVAATAIALPSDHDKPIHIEADRVNIDEKHGVSHYIGNVRMTQGTMAIAADEVFVHLEDGMLDKVIVIGEPARFQQQTERSGEPVKSRAERIEYYADKGKLLLKDNAVVIQDGNRFSGDHIEYDTRASVVKADKKADSDARVRAVIQPKSLQEPDSSEPEAGPQ